MTEPVTEPDLAKANDLAPDGVIRMTREEYEAHYAARRGRNIALALGLLAFMVIVFFVTIARLGGNVPHA